jgi:hypothetical protein
LVSGQGAAQQCILFAPKFAVEQFLRKLSRPPMPLAGKHETFYCLPARDLRTIKEVVRSRGREPSAEKVGMALQLIESRITDLLTQLAKASTQLRYWITRHSILALTLQTRIRE